MSPVDQQEITLRKYDVELKLLGSIGPPGPPGPPGPGGGSGSATKVFNIKDSAFGAIGSGSDADSHSDSVGIKLALAAAASEGGDVYVPFGHYRFVDPVNPANALVIPSNVRMIGDGWAISQISAASTNTAPNFITATGNHDVTIQGITVDGNVGSGGGHSIVGNVIYLNNTTRFNFIKSQILPGRHHGIGGQDCSGIKIKDSVLDGQNLLNFVNLTTAWNNDPNETGFRKSAVDPVTGLYTGVSLIYFTGSDDIKIISNDVKNTLGHQIDIEESDNFVIIDNDLFNAPNRSLHGGFGIFLNHCSNYSVDDNRVLGSSNDSINSTWCRDFTITNNTVRSNGDGVYGGYGIIAYNGCMNFVIDNNIIFGYLTNPNLTSINPGLGVEGWFHNGVVTNNIVQGFKKGTHYNHSGIGAGIVVTGMRWAGSITANPSTPTDIRYQHYYDESNTCGVLIVANNTATNNSVGLVVRESVFSGCPGYVLGTSPTSINGVAQPANQRINVDSTTIVGNRLDRNIDNDYDFTDWFVVNRHITTGSTINTGKIKIDVEGYSLNTGGGGGGSGISPGIFTNPGSLIIADANSVPKEFKVGADDKIIIADHTQPDGLRWFTRVDPAANALGYNAWTFDPKLIQGNMSVTSGTVYLSGLWIPAWTPIDNITVMLMQMANGSRSGAGIVRFGVCNQDGVMIAKSANMISAVEASNGSVGPLDIPLTLFANSPVVTVDTLNSKTVHETNKQESPKGWHYLVMLVACTWTGSGAAQPQFGRGWNSYIPAIQRTAPGTGTVAPRPYATGVTLNRTDIPDPTLVTGQNLTAPPSGSVIAGGLTQQSANAFWGAISQ